MEQLNLFDFEMKFDEFKFTPQIKPVKTLKREVKSRVFDPEAIERKLRDSIGTLYLHQLKLKEYSGSWYDYNNYLLERLYKVFFKELVESLHKTNYEEAFEKIELLLSDEQVEVKLFAETGRHIRMVSGFAFNISVKSEGLETVYLTGSQFKCKKKHNTRRYFTNDRAGSTRMVGDITLVLSELLLMKEIRHYYSQEENKALYKDTLKSKFLSADVLYIDLNVMANEPVIVDSLNEMAYMNNLKIKESSSRYIYCSLMGYFERINIAGMKLCYHEQENKNPFYGIDRNGLFEILAGKMLIEAMPKLHEVEIHIKQLRQSSGEYAATFETKKNIPQKVLDKMNSSALLEYFSAIEYDELVDLENVTRFEREIASFIKTFKVPVPKDATFKVRRLGKIKAAGVFYPLFNTLAVDINHPNSFIHEYWHMIDYYMKDNQDEFTGQRLSSQRNFEPIIKAYKSSVMKAIQELPLESIVRTKFFGKTKYNKEYYFENTEVFARSAEIYFSNALNGKSSLVEDIESVYYPSDDNFKMLIDAYFTNLLKEVGHEEVDAA